MKLGLKLWSTNVGNYLHETERFYADGVFDYIELFVVPGTENTIGAWKRLHDEKGVPFIVHNAHAAMGFNLADRTRESANVGIYLQSRRFAEALDAGYVIFHGGVDGTIEETVRQLKRLEEPRALLENKPAIPLPNDLGARNCRGATVEEIEYVLQETGCGFCLDVGHAICSAKSQKLAPYAFVGDLFRRFSPAMLHLSDIVDVDSPFDSHLHLGTGSLDFARLGQLLPMHGMTVSIETEKSYRDCLDDFRLDVEAMRRMYA